MILTYKQCIEKYGSDYLLKKAIAAQEIFQKEKGIYSLTPHCAELEIINVKYPKAIFTGESAFYYHSLTDVIPDNYFLATERTESRIKDPRVVQSFLKSDIFDIGKIKMKYNNVEISIYNQERMLIELMRFKGKMPYDYYKEIICNYRKRIDRLDISLVEDYAYSFSNGDRLMDMIQTEVL